MNNWSINKKGYDPETHNHFAPVYTVGNGYMCCRGFMEEQREGVAGLGGIYMAGVFGRASYKPWKGEGQELVNLPNFFWVDIDIDGKPLVLSPENLRGYTETLDVKNAVFTRSYQYFLNGKPLAEFTFTRFLSRADIRIAGQQITVTPLADGLTVQLRLGTDPGVTNLNEVSSEPYPVQPGKKHWDILSRDAESLRVCVRGGEKTELAFVQRVTAEGVEVSPGEYAITARVNKPAGEPVTVQKLVSVYKSDTGSVPLPADGPLAKARAKMENAPGYSEVLSAHQKAMSAFWESADVRVEGDDETQISLRYNILQLEQSFPRHTSEVSIGARGLTGEMYEGSVFWDTEIFMLPFFTMTDPAAAKNLLMFRYHTLPEAREHAASNWFKGAMYGWQVNARGVEQTPQG
ncbi:MAG: hypothetical protein LBR83_10315, partial [Clostridiales bacterium]|nr:hypothetical protein [Clostridiales bacterium]